MWKHMRMGFGLCCVCALHTLHALPTQIRSKQFNRRELPGQCADPLMNQDPISGDCTCPTGSSLLDGYVCVCDSAGLYLSASSKTCSPCLAGWYCDINAVPTQCPAYYLSDTGATSVADCYVFTGIYVNASVFTNGHFNDQNITGMVSIQEWIIILTDNCPMGYYCNETDGRPTACPEGTYQPDRGASTIHRPCRYRPVFLTVPGANTTGTNTTVVAILHPFKYHNKTTIRKHLPVQQRL
jgi:hypothetical protein